MRVNVDNLPTELVLQFNIATCGIGTEYYIPFLYLYLSPFQLFKASALLIATQ